jgi:hypothetical protein
MLACYGAGTPDSSAYRHWLEKLKQAGQFGGQAQSVLTSLPSGDQPPFIAALPQAVLANPNGPLAVIGHIDLAWTYSFEERDTGTAVSRPSKFMEVLRSALRGDRVGTSFRELVRSLAVINNEVAELQNDSLKKGQSEPSDAARSGHLWMLRQDLSGYILLGDPAVRLPVSRKRKPKREAHRAASTPSIYTSKPATKGEPPEAGPAPQLDIDAIERAIGHILAGRDQNEVADEHRIDRAALRRFADTYRKAGRAALGEG